MVFKQGEPSPNKGKKGLQGANKTSFKKGQTPWNKDKKMPAHCGFQKGNQLSKGVKRKPRYGKDSSSWKGGKAKLGIRIRKLTDYSNWRKTVFERDDYTCQLCGQKGGWLEVHHKKPFREILKENDIKTIESAVKCILIWDIDNGITYCKECHKKEDVHRR